MAKRKPKMEVPTPIPKTQVKEWNELIARTKQVKQFSDHASMQLVLIAGEVKSKYGESNLERWADECDIAYSSAARYRRLSRQGFNQEFFDKWSEIGFTKIRYISEHLGTLKGPWADVWLQWAKDHPDTPASALQNHMINDVAKPPQIAEEKLKDIKRSLSQKKKAEKYSATVQRILERHVEAHPEDLEKVINYRIMPETSAKEVDIALGIRTKEEETLVNEGYRILLKLKTFNRWMRDNDKDIEKAIAHGHEHSDVIKGQIASIMREAFKLNQVELPRIDLPDDQIIDITKKVK